MDVPFRSKCCSSVLIYTLVIHCIWKRPCLGLLVRLLCCEWQKSNSNELKQKENSLPLVTRRGFAGGTNGKELACQCRRHKRGGFSPWVGKILWRRKWQPTPISLPGRSHGQRSLGGCSMVLQRVGHDWVTRALWPESPGVELTAAQLWPQHSSDCSTALCKDAAEFLALLPLSLSSAFLWVPVLVSDRFCVCGC